MPAPRQQDSNTVETRISYETSFKTADASAVWYPVEVNSFSDARANFEKVARTPIFADRKRKKGTLVDLDAMFGCNTDLTQHNHQVFLPALFRAAFRAKPEVGALTGVASNVITMTDASDFAANDLLVLRNTDPAIGNSNKLLLVTAADATTVTVAGLADETFTSDALLVKVGVQAAAGDVEIDASGVYPVLTSAASIDFDDLGVSPGESLFIGGDAADTFFPTNDVNNCVVRVRSVDGGSVTIDKASKGVLVTEAPVTATVQIFLGRFIKDENGALIVHPSLQVERQLNTDDTDNPGDVQSEYYPGAVYKQATFNWDPAAKVTIDSNFVCADQELRDGTTGLKAGTRPTVEQADAQNTTSDLKRVRLAQVVVGNEAPNPLAVHIERGSVVIDNGDEALKALTVLGAFAMNPKDFVVTGSLETYFSTIAVTAAVRNNVNCTLDLMTFKNNAGWTLDLPLITLKDAPINAEKNSPIKQPLNFDAASGEEVDPLLDYTVGLTLFDYLPDRAATPNTIED